MSGQICPELQQLYQDLCVTPLVVYRRSYRVKLRIRVCQQSRPNDDKERGADVVESLSLLYQLPHVPALGIPKIEHHQGFLVVSTEEGFGPGRQETICWMGVQTVSPGISEHLAKSINVRIDKSR